MSPLVIALIGPLLGGAVGIMVFGGKRLVTKTDAQLAAISHSMEVISEKVTAIQVELPTTFVSREDFFRHIRDEERWQDSLQGQLTTIKDDIHDIRNHGTHP